MEAYQQLDDAAFFSGALLALYILAAFNLVVLPFITAPYGKHTRPGWGPTLRPALAWFLMESPTLWLTAMLYPLGRHRAHPLSLLPLALFLLHYLHRTVIYPLRLLRQGASKPFPVSVALFGFAFNVLNAYLQSRALTHYYADLRRGIGPLDAVRVAAGAAVFFWGMSVNVRSDLALLRLKRESAALGGAYRVPRGGWFDRVCCPNYMGESAEWLGWAVVAWNPAAFGFFASTCSNLVPRARANLEWYRRKFGEELPPSWKAIVPYVY